MSIWFISKNLDGKGSMVERVGDGTCIEGRRRAHLASTVFGTVQFAAGDPPFVETLFDVLAEVFIVWIPGAVVSVQADFEVMPGRSGIDHVSPPSAIHALCVLPSLIWDSRTSSVSHSRTLATARQAFWRSGGFQYRRHLASRHGLLPP